MNIETGSVLEPYYGSVMTVFLDIDGDGRVIVAQDDSYRHGGGTPADEWHRRTITVSADHDDDPDGRTHVSPNAVIEYLEGSDGQSLLSRIFAGSDVVWDGHNRVGTLDDDAEEALQALCEALGDLPRANSIDWQAYDWFGQCHAEIAALATSEAARAWGAESLEDGDGNTVLLDDDAEDYCERIWLSAHEDDEN